ncbi:hypothetical protein C8R44DRAFT_158355 [Mycena epipterygia]|nr:hypothetical protein C8R44DRAFT_158355 [Mycena epipterygia]
MLPKEGGTPIPETGRTVPVAEIGATSSKPDDDAMDSDDDVDMALLLDVDHSTCEHGCQDGWLSPRTKFVLQVTAAVASDLVRHTGELAGEYGHVGPVYLTNFLPAGITPRGKKAAPLWVEAFAVLFEVIADIFKAGKIPTADLLEQTIARDKGKKKHFDVYRKQGADCEQLLQALVYGAKYEWEENDFAEAHCSEEWEALPACKKHDFDWGMAEDVLSA